MPFYVRGGVGPVRFGHRVTGRDVSAAGSGCAAYVLGLWVVPLVVLWPLVLGVDLGTHKGFSWVLAGPWWKWVVALGWWGVLWVAAVRRGRPGSV